MSDNDTKSQALPTRKQDRIDCVVCPDCYVSIPADQGPAHREWHIGRGETVHAS